MATATLTWAASAGAVTYLVQYKTVAAGSYTTFGTVGTTTAAITGLLEGTAYDFSITSNCTTGISTPIVITGTTPCTDVSGLSVSIPGTTANLSWTWIPEAVSYIINYKLHSLGSYTAASGSPLINPGSGPVTFSIVGLTAGNAYDFQVFVNCAVGTSTPGSVVSGTSSCPTPGSLGVVFS